MTVEEIVACAMFLIPCFSIVVWVLLENKRFDKRLKEWDEKWGSKS
jgi:hypothetical protein